MTLKRKSLVLYLAFTLLPGAAFACTVPQPPNDDAFGEADLIVVASIVGTKPRQNHSSKSLIDSARIELAVQRVLATSGGYANLASSGGYANLASSGGYANLASSSKEWSAIWNGNEIPTKWRGSKGVIVGLTSRLADGGRAEVVVPGGEVTAKAPR